MTLERPTSQRYADRRVLITGAGSGIGQACVLRILAEGGRAVAADISEGDALLSYAADIGADLLVCGMYGHSRLQEFTFGGVTRSLIQEMTLPTFMVH